MCLLDENDVSFSLPEILENGSSFGLDPKPIGIQRDKFDLCECEFWWSFRYSRALVLVPSWEIERENLMDVSERVGNA